MNVLITGALGYLGGRLVAHLRDRPEFTLRLFVPQIPRELREWVEGLDVREGDITQPATMRGISEGMDRVVHLAAMNEVDCARDPLAALTVNVEGTLHLAQALAPSVERVVYMSTFHVYGAHAAGRVVEDTPLAPVHPYAATKAMGELALAWQARERGIGAVVLRASNGFGAPLYPGVDRWKLIVNDLCRQAIRNGRIAVRTARQVRNFVALTDIAEAIRLTLVAPLDGVNVFNVGGRETVTALDVARHVQEVFEELYGRALPLERPAAAPEDRAAPLEFVFDRLGELGYLPKGSLRDGIRETLRFCDAHRQLLGQAP